MAALPCFSSYKYIMLHNSTYHTYMQSFVSLAHAPYEALFHSECNFIQLLKICHVDSGTGICTLWKLTMVFPNKTNTTLPQLNTVPYHVVAHSYLLMCQINCGMPVCTHWRLSIIFLITLAQRNSTSTLPYSFDLRPHTRPCSLVNPHSHTYLWHVYLYTWRPDHS